MPFERAARILEEVEAAPRLGLAAPVADVDLVAADDHAGLPHSRIRAARSWLFALGYLADSADRADYDVALRTAVTRFQQEAGLTVDGWIGTRQTWPRLQELVAFEQPLDLAHWTEPDGQPRPALARAVRARLAVYGFGARGDGIAEGDLNPDVQRFFEVLDSLGAAPGDLVGTPAEQLANVLQHDAHLARINGATDTARVRALMTELDDRDEAAAAFGLLLNLAKVELWLAQEAEVSITDVYTGRLRFGRSLVMPRKIRRDMRRYMIWVDEEIPEVSGLRRAFNRAIRADEPYQALSLFLRTVSEHGQLEDPMSEERLAQLDRFYAEAGGEGEDPAAETVRVLTGEGRFRSRLWDGLRRLWSWLKKALEKAIATGKRVLRLARDVAAYAFRAASEGFQNLFRVIGAFVGHVDTAVGRSNVDARGLVWVLRERGRDVNVISTPGAPKGYSDAYTEQLSISASIFRRASSVLGRAVAFALSLSGIAITSPLIFRTLIIAARNLRQTLSYLDEISTLQARHDALEKVLKRA